MLRGLFLPALLACCLTAPCPAETSGGACVPACGPVAVCPPIRPQDAIWLVDARGGCLKPEDRQAARLRYFVRRAGGWQPGTADDFYGEESVERPTVIWIHGDRVDDSSAFGQALDVYRRVIAAQPDAAPLRFVVFSWPTTRQYTGPLRDSRLKFSLTAPAAFRLGGLLSRLPEETPVCLIGYSYGARVATGGLHALAGGDLAGWKLDNPRPERRPLRVTLLAPAMENGLIVPGRGHGMALSVSERMLVIRNSADFVLRLYPRIYPRGNGPQALGSVGLAPRQLGEYAERFDQLDAAPYLGRGHQWQGYLYHRGLLERVGQNLALPRAANASVGEPDSENVAGR